MWKGGEKLLKFHINSIFQSYGRLVVDWLKRPSRRLEKLNTEHRIGTVSLKRSNLTFFCQKLPFMSKTVEKGNF